METTRIPPVVAARGHHLDVLVGRLAVTGLLGWIAWIHLHLWNGGYRHIHIIGNLFLANFAGCVFVGAAVLLIPARYLALAALAGAGTAAATLVGLVLSVNVGLFGFRDSSNAPFAHLSVWLEAITIAVGLALAVRSFLLARQPG